MNTNVPKFPSGEELIDREADALRRDGREFPTNPAVLAEDPADYLHTVAGNAVIDLALE